MRFRPFLTLLFWLLTPLSLALSLTQAPWYGIWPFEMVGACYFWFAAATVLLLGALLSSFRFKDLRRGLGGKRRWLLVVTLSLALSLYVDTTLGWSIVRPAAAAQTTGVQTARAQTARAQTTASSHTSLTVMTYNVNVEAWDTEAVAEVIREHPADVLGLIEPTRSQIRQLRPELKQYYAYRYQSRGIPQEQLSLFSRYRILEARVDNLGTGTPSLLAVIDVNGTPVEVDVVHPKIPVLRSTYNQRNDTIRALANHAQEAQTQAIPTDAAQGQTTRPLIVMGDFNAVPWSQYMQDFTKTSRLTSAYRGHGLRLTWYYPNAASHSVLQDRLFRLLKIPIDHIFVSSDIQVADLTTAPSGVSDHCPLIATLQIPKTLSANIEG